MILNILLIILAVVVIFFVLTMIIYFFNLDMKLATKLIPLMNMIYNKRKRDKRW